MDTGVLLARATHILLITVLKVLHTLACTNQTMMARMEMGTLTSPYTGSLPKSVSCQWTIKAEDGKQALYLRVMFSSTKVINCQRTYVDAHAGGMVLGRWCDLDSDLIHCPAPTVQITAYNSMGVEFYFEVMYSTGPFKAPTKHIGSYGQMDSGRFGGIVGGVIGGVTLVVILAVIVFYKYPRSRNRAVHNSRQASPVSYTNNDQVVNIRQDDPPDYWTVVSTPPPAPGVTTDRSDTRGRASGLLDFGAAPS